jgi:molecular chaperone GrpE
MNPDTETPATDQTTKDGNSVDQLRIELERVNLEKQQLFERLARAQAEFQNSRRRLELDQEQALQYANQSLLKKMLPLMDNLERAVAVDPAKADAASLLHGVQVVRDQFEAILKEQRVETVAPKPGDAFDPAKHEALLQQPSDQPEGSVATLLNRGYSMLGRTLRPAQVSVSKGPA